MTLEELDKKILTLPKSDFPSSYQTNGDDNGNRNSTNNSRECLEKENQHAAPPLLLLKLPPSLHTDDLSSSQFFLCDGDNDGVSSGGECRLINESKGTTFDLVKVESSNTYVMFPPPAKKSKITAATMPMAGLSSSGTQSQTQSQTQTQAQGRLLREKNTFFLECAAPKQNLGNMIAQYLQQNCIYPPSRGISVLQLSQKFRYSKKEVLDVLTNKIHAFPIPPKNKNSCAERCYGVLSEDIEKDTWDVMLSVLSEWDGGIDYANNGVIIDKMVETILSKDNEMEEGVVRYCLEQCTVTNENKTLGHGGVRDPSSTAKLDAKYIAQKIAHQIFNSRMAPWEQSHFLSEWHRLMPGVGKDYEPNVGLLRGIAISTTSVNPIYKNDEQHALSHSDCEENLNNVLYWKYFPKEALPTTDCEKFRAIFKVQDRWRLEDLEAYFDKGELESKLLKHTRRIEDSMNSVWYISA